MEHSVLCHLVWKTGTGMAQQERVHQDYQASHSASLLHNHHSRQHQAKEPWHDAQPDC